MNKQNIANKIKLRNKKLNFQNRNNQKSNIKLMTNNKKFLKNVFEDKNRNQKVK